MSTVPVRLAIAPEVLHRIRNHIIEYLEVAASFNAQLAYQEKAPTLNVANEVLHQWADWVGEHWAQDYTEPVFATEELIGMRIYDALLQPLAGGAIDSSQSLAQLHCNPQWQGLRAEAEKLLDVFRLRGLLPSVGNV